MYKDLAFNNLQWLVCHKTQSKLTNIFVLFMTEIIIKSTLQDAWVSENIFHLSNGYIVLLVHFSSFLLWHMNSLKKDYLKHIHWVGIVVQLCIMTLKKTLAVYLDRCDCWVLRKLEGIHWFETSSYRPGLNKIPTSGFASQRNVRKKVKLKVPSKSSTSCTRLLNVVAEDPWTSGVTLEQARLLDVERPT